RPSSRACRGRRSKTQPRAVRPGAARLLARNTCLCRFLRRAGFMPLEDRPHRPPERLGVPAVGMRAGPCVEPRNATMIRRPPGAPPICPGDGKTTVKAPCRLVWTEAAFEKDGQLLHEMVHALRQMRAEDNSVPTWDKGYDNEEE